MSDSLINAEILPPSPLAKLKENIAVIRAQLRPGQTQMADWQVGPLAVSAVPGAGKSTGMAAAAAIAIARQYEYYLNTGNKDCKQLIVVTFTRSATANIKLQIRENLKKYLYHKQDLPFILCMI